MKIVKLCPESDLGGPGTACPIPLAEAKRKGETQLPMPLSAAAEGGRPRGTAPQDFTA